MSNPFFIAAASRSGSNFFMSLLSSTGKLNLWRDMLGKGRRLKDAPDEDVLACMDAVKSEVLIDECWGCKVDIRELSFIKRWLAIKRIPINEIKWVWLYRRDKVRQSISHLRGEATNAWHLFEGSPPIEDEIDIELTDLNRMVALYSLIDNVWQQFFRANGINPYIISYEDFIDESVWSDCIEGVLKFLSIQYDLPLKIRTHHKRLSTDEGPYVYSEFLNQHSFKHWGYNEIDKWLKNTF